MWIVYPLIHLDQLFYDLCMEDAERVLGCFLILSSWPLIFGEQWKQMEQPSPLLTCCSCNQAFYTYRQLKGYWIIFFNFVAIYCFSHLIEIIFNWEIKNDKKCYIFSKFTECHQPINFITAQRKKPRRGDKFHWSMTQWEFQDNVTLLIIFFAFLF